MYYGMGRGRGAGWGSGGGMGFGFRGSSPPWPYVGRGRGGLPRCGYYSRSGTPQPAGDELVYLKSQAEAVKEQLEQIEARIRRLKKESNG